MLVVLVYARDIPRNFILLKFKNENILPILAEAPESTRSLTELSRKMPMDRNSNDERDLKNRNITGKISS